MRSCKRGLLKVVEEKSLGIQPEPQRGKGKAELKAEFLLP